MKVAVIVVLIILVVIIVVIVFLIIIIIIIIITGNLGNSQVAHYSLPLNLCNRFAITIITAIIITINIIIATIKIIQNNNNCSN